MTECKLDKMVNKLNHKDAAKGRKDSDGASKSGYADKNNNRA